MNLPQRLVRGSTVKGIVAPALDIIGVESLLPGSERTGAAKMNERILELAEQAGLKLPFGGFPDYNEFNFEQFAELIVQECANVSKNYADGPLPLSIAHAIKEHFGAKE
jgi:hypothetical protein